MTTYQVETRDRDTGICMLWVRVSQEDLDWIVANKPSQSRILMALGRPFDIYFRDNTAVV